MHIKTGRFGTIEIDERKNITFPHGIPGFAEREYAIVVIESHLPFFWLQAISNPDLAFVLSDPFLFFPDYSPKISVPDKTFLGISDEMMLYAITVVREGPVVSLNLLAPLVINTKTNVGKQVILEGANYTVRHSVPLAAIRAKVKAV